MLSKCLSKIINSFNKFSSIRSRGYTEKFADRMNIEFVQRKHFHSTQKECKRK